MATTGPDLLVISYQALDETERAEAFERISELRLRDQAGQESETAIMLRSLRRVAEFVGEPPTADQYREAVHLLKHRGELIVPFSRVLRHFGSWRTAREALDLSETNTVRRIDARFRYRKLGKVWRYTEDTLRDALVACVEHYGHVPQVAEFAWWRDRELEKAKAEGNDALHLPSATPYRRRWGSWEAALLGLGYTPDEVAERLERR